MLCASGSVDDIKFSRDGCGCDIVSDGFIFIGRNSSLRFYIFELLTGVKSAILNCLVGIGSNGTYCCE